TFPKPIELSATVLLDRERCVSCARCTRFAEQVAGDPLIELFERGGKQQVGISDDQPFDSYFSGNTVQICPVGALTSSQYRFRSRPFDLVSTPTVCEHCASGCSQRTDSRRSTVMRRLAWDEPEVNEEWNCDKGRFAFAHASSRVVQSPQVRGADGIMHPASWPEAAARIAEGLAAAGSSVGVLPGGRLTLEDAFAYSRFARAVLGTDDIDFRARPQSSEEAAFLSSAVAGAGLGVTYSDLEQAPFVLLAGLDPEDESPIVFLRLRKAARKRSLAVASIAAWASPGLEKMFGTLLPTLPGSEGEVLAALGSGATSLGAEFQRAAALLREPGAVILVGERLASVEGGLSAALALASSTGARLAWIPRRAGERGAVEAGLLPGLLPGGRSLSDASARAEVASAWGVSADELPAAQGRDLNAIIAAATAGELAALVVGGIDPLDHEAPAALLTALESVGFLVSIDPQPTIVSEIADVWIPLSTVTSKSGTFVNWEGRNRQFGQVFRDALVMTDARILAMVADELDRPMGRTDTGSLRAGLAALPAVSSPQHQAPAVAPRASTAYSHEVVVATWRHLLDEGTMQSGDDDLAATARTAVARLSARTAQAAGVAVDGVVVVMANGGELTLPIEITDMPDGVVWLPTNSRGSTLRRSLGIDHGACATLRPGASS
ncbi:MAG: NADH-quinone oxidoreductase subunit G, partial [Actinobacteria bacterium]|nr:NADH-quinone oxidoreductase subunit G [Actinomycetota bacterium]